MSVLAILENKPKNIITATSDMSIATIAKLLAKHRIGAIVVCDSANKVEGIISERDIVRDLANDGADIMQYPVSRCMTKKVVSCTSEDTIQSVMEIMTENHFRHMPVCEDDKLIGIISIGDVVKIKIQQAEKDAQDMRDYIAS